MVSRIAHRRADLAHATVLRIRYQQRSLSHFRRTHVSGGDLSEERVVDQVVKLRTKGQILREGRVGGEVVPDMLAAAAEVSCFHQQVLPEAMLDVRVPHL